MIYHNKISLQSTSKVKLLTFFLHKLFTISYIFLLGIGASSCKKLAETPVPTDQVAENAVYNNDATAISVMSGIYSSMNTGPIQGALSNVGTISLMAGLSADEYTLASVITNVRYIAYYHNALSQVDAVTGLGAEHWAPLYNFIFRCNAAVTGLNGSTSLNPTVKNQLLGEAKFMRAFFYFYLVNEFGDVPLALTTDPQTITLLPRTSKAQVYSQIIADLLDAENNLTPNYLDVTLLKTTNERVRPTKWAAAALLARVYLYTGDYSNAETQASIVINNTSLFTLLPLNSVFLKNSKEAIWQIQPTDINLNTQEGQALIIPSSGPSDNNPVYLSDTLMNSFDTNDLRAIYKNWIDTITVAGKFYRFPLKYKIRISSGVTSATQMSEYFMVLRLGEQYMIRAEARAQQGNTSGAQADLNAIRNRAGLLNYSGATDQASLLTAILNERRHELFSEWGHRWFDLKRTGKIDAVMSGITPLKANGAPWKSYQQLYPVPIADIQKSPNLTQNNGYQ